MNSNRLQAARKTGEEQVHSDGQSQGWSLSSFWAWSMSDLVCNTTRGMLSEFIVAHACDISTDGARDEWASYDLISTDGIRIEVKSAAYIQSWHQDKLSAIVFRTPKTHHWDPGINQYEREPSRQADVYVFALLAHRDKVTVDPLNLDQWRFFVLPAHVLNERARGQITLKALEKLTNGPVSFNELASAIRMAARAGT